MSFPEVDLKWMQHALKLAEKARSVAEVPVGAIVVYENEIIGEGYNQPIQACDPTAHAEIIALRQAATRIGNYRLINCHLYTTLEPCLMCAGSLLHARIAKLIYAASDPRMGAIDSVFNVLNSPAVNHRVAVSKGILAEESALILKQFFADRR